MPGLIIGNKEYNVTGATVLNYRDHPELKLKPGEDMRPRHTRWVRSVFWHNTKNVPVLVRDGMGPSTDLGSRIARLWSTDHRQAGAHLSVDWDGTVACHADLLLDAAYHAGSVNEVSVGGELYEDANGVMYEEQLKAAVDLTLWLCRFFRIQLQMPKIALLETKGPWTIPRVVEGGEDCVGVFGHCHQSKAKPYDPSVAIFERLAKAGFREFNFGGGITGGADDKAYWSPIQKALGLRPDGVPGPKTCDALQALSYMHGLYIDGGPLQ